MEEKDGVPTQWVVASLNAFYHFLIFVDLSAFMFSKQKTDLEPSAFISLWECRQKDAKENETTGGFGQRGRGNGFPHTRNVSNP